MAGKKKRTRKNPARRSTTRRVSRTRRAARTVRRYATRKAKGTLESLQPMQSMKDAAKQAVGMLAAQFCAKKFADGGGANDPDWNIKNYALALAGAFGAGIAGDMLKKGSGKEFLKGGMALVLYKLVTNEVSQFSDFVDDNFGETTPQFTEADLMAMNGMGSDEVYLMGEDGTWTEDGMVPRGSLGEALTPPSMQLGEADPYAKHFAQMATS